VSQLLKWTDQAEYEIRDALSIDEPRKLVETFAGLVRESGTEGERHAAQYVAEQLEALGIPHQVYTPTLYISLPRGASVEILESEQRLLHAKTPSFSVSTEKPIHGDLVYVPTEKTQTDADLFEVSVIPDTEIAGKIALVEGLPTPRKVADLTTLGALAAVFVSPGERIHEGIATLIWGAPDLMTDGQQPRIPVASINGSDGAWLRDHCMAEPLEVAVSTRVEEGWVPCPLVVAEIRGMEDPARFVLAHGHIDSWHAGIGDNATGDGALLELARVFHEKRHLLRRSLRVAWWPGHSTGRYAGSTWYADQFGIDLANNCIAQMNVDSPGCRWATEYLDIDWTPEAEAFAQRAIHDTTGCPATGERPVRAGDYSFNNIGITSFFMLLSTMSPEVRAQHGYYVVGGCGGNIAWHTEDDTMEIADADNLLRDLRVYATALIRALNTPLHPFDFRAHVSDILATLARYQEMVGDRFDLGPAIDEANALLSTLDDFYGRAEGMQTQQLGDPNLMRANAVQRHLARLLIPINFTRERAFRHDPALEVPPLPDLAPAEQLEYAEPGSHLAHVLTTDLTRGRNQVVWALQQARQMVEQAR